MNDIERLNSPSDSESANSMADREAAAEARATVLARRVAALEAVVAVERRLRDVQEMAVRAAKRQLAERDGRADITVPRPGARKQAPVDDDATIPVPQYHSDADVSPARDSTSTEQGTRPNQSLHPQRPTISIIPRPAPLQDRGPPIGPQSPLALARGFELFEYRIDSVLGQGGFGITYLATDINLNVKVAIKEYLPSEYATRASDHSVSPRWAEDNDFYLSGLECFLVEARTLATFRHSNIVRVARFFEAHRTAYMVLEYERGKPLKQWWEKRKNMPEQQLLSLLQPLLDGLALVHDSGYLHRDIKPDNIYVRKEDGSLVLLDFGAARQTVGGAESMADVVTPGYAPAEQYAGGEQGPWTDVYALGATLYWMVTGAKPAPAPERQSGAAEYIPAVQAGAGRYSEQFLKAIDWALTIEASGRPQSIAEFSQGLFASHAGSLGLQDALRLGELESQKRLTKGVRQLGRALWRPASWPLAVKMTIAMMVAALAPMIITAYYNLNASVATVSNSELRNLESLAQSTAGRIAQLIGDSRNLSNFLATDPLFIDYLQAPNERKKQAINARLVSLIKNNPDVHLSFLMNRDGLALVSSELGVAGVNFKFREYFQQAVKGQPFMSGVIVGSTAGKPGIYYANPVLDANKAVIGVVVLRIKGTSITEILQQVQVNSARVPFMIDGDGILVQYPDNKQLYRSLMPLSKEKLGEIVADQRFRRHRIEDLHMPELAQAMIGAAHTGSISYRSTLSGNEQYAGYAPVRGHNWVVGVTESRTRFHAPQQRLFRNVLYSVGLVGLVFLVLAVMFARSIVRPVVRLTEAANALKDGDYDRANIRVTSNDEIGRLARTFNVMIDVLRQRDRERKRGKLGHSNAEAERDEDDSQA